MGRSNLVSLFAPTLMTVDDDPVSYLNAQYEFAVLSTMIENYKWLFQVDADEEMKEVVRLTVANCVPRNERSDSRIKSR